jgi:hypothetical protein
MALTLLFEDLVEYIHAVKFSCPEYRLVTVACCVTCSERKYFQDENVS